MTPKASNEKILDSDLATFAATNEGSRRSVIVEVELPNVYAPKKPSSSKIARPKSAQDSSDDKYADTAKASMAAFEKYLGTLGLLSDAVRLSSASSFVLDVKPGDLRALSESPLVAAIRPNRVHKVVGKN